MCIIARGALQVSIPSRDGPEIVVAQLGTGEVVEEIQILTGGKRTAPSGRW